MSYRVSVILRCSKNLTFLPGPRIVQQCTLYSLENSQKTWDQGEQNQEWIQTNVVTDVSARCRPMISYTECGQQLGLRAFDPGVALCGHARPTQWDEHL